MRDYVGRTAVDFELADVQDRVFRQEDFLGHWLLLVFHRHLG